VKLIRGRQAAAASEQRSATFSGSVWADPVMPSQDGVTIAAVFFLPEGRTHWHHHEWGQVLLVTHGRGFVQVKDGEGGWVEPGDVVHFGPGEVHWHGAGPETFLAHTAISLGRTDWLDEVSADDYRRSTAGR
jgi:quercetin dioxygenase-like cupin family protein